MHEDTRNKPQYIEPNKYTQVRTVQDVLSLVEHLKVIEMSITGFIESKEKDIVKESFDIKAYKDINCELELKHTLTANTEMVKMSGNVLAGVNANINLEIQEVYLNGKAFLGKDFSKVVLEIVEMFMKENNEARVLMLFETGKKVPVYINSFKAGEYYRKIKTSTETRITVFKNNQKGMLGNLEGKEFSAIYVFEDGMTEEQFIEKHKLSAMVKVSENQFRVLDKTKEEQYKC